MEENDKLLEIIESFVKDGLITKNEDYEKAALQMILSNSIQAASFVAIIEEEFNIEFDDDDINADFFSNTFKIIELIKLRS